MYDMQNNILNHSQICSVDVWQKPVLNFIYYMTFYLFLYKNRLANKLSNQGISEPNFIF